jgi:hypothetical protein
VESRQPRSLEVRVQALQARAEDDSRRLREQHDVVLRLRAIVRQYQEQAVADAAEELQIRRAQAEIRRLAELRRAQAAGPHPPTKPTATRREPADVLLRALRESLKRDRPR